MTPCRWRCWHWQTGGPPYRRQWESNPTTNARVATEIRCADKNSGSRSRSSPMFEPVLARRGFIAPCDHAIELNCGGFHNGDIAHGSLPQKSRFRNLDSVYGFTELSNSTVWRVRNWLSQRQCNIGPVPRMLTLRHGLAKHPPRTGQNRTVDVWYNHVERPGRANARRDLASCVKMK